jgi:CMP-N,N'-diacetyllegionaminic acid synthase
MVEIKKKKVSLIKKLNKTSHFSRRQSSPRVFDINGSIYIWKRSRLLKSDSLFSKNTDVYIMPQSKSIDIDSYFDLNLIKYLLKKNIND